MARVTVEDCLKRVGSRFELVHLAARRAKMLLSGAKPVVEADNREIVTALREVAEGKVYFVEPEAEEPESQERPNEQAEGEPPTQEERPES
ncbi:MAG: DNA-directed RNA polymerase subunit omega [Deltaproteobacteria bacterium]|nr:DNA-directed RNA polymerase subunit omega [Deltaproteobacteria bacterium]MBW2120393.1 DNA-directed RNA polymerase subunit omega [Deltaproteobacteria bacterium]